ncbi:hypothetical protein SAMN04515671_1704 [Nakamurella panacisegetis]|uniref:Uncharacterized protein n=1 Tax=Nakamurella panacisegetis TaxID=1090615 RepID=A0A1H0LKN9_9ACTN|nr:hypothetical protein SAMN04515671_1704 [Nakamurella panacisegetis]
MQAAIPDDIPPPESGTPDIIGPPLAVFIAAGIAP